MGIAGLLPLFKSVMEPIHVRELRGQRVGIDTYSWLHKAAFSCAKELALGEPTTRHINYVLTRAEMLRSYGVTPVLVFDGGPLPSKKTTNDKRATQRAEKKQLGMEHLKRGNMAAAIECFQSCISITPEIVRQTIDALQRRNIEYMVAPYEADAQLVYLEKIGFISAIITEDSDMIVFGAIRLVLKMDKEGSAVQFNRELMWSTSDIDLKQWNSDKFRKMCILSGCDYLPNIPGIGLKRAHGLMIKFGWNVNRIVGELSSAKKTAQHVPINYLDEFDRAELTFLHQRVYDPFAQDLAHLHPLPPALQYHSKPQTDLNEGGEMQPPSRIPWPSLDFIGAWIDTDTARGIAAGNINPTTRQSHRGRIYILTVPASLSRLNASSRRLVSNYHDNHGNSDNGDSGVDDNEDDNDNMEFRLPVRLTSRTPTAQSSRSSASITSSTSLMSLTSIISSSSMTAVSEPVRRTSSRLQSKLNGEQHQPQHQQPQQPHSRVDQASLLFKSKTTLVDRSEIQIRPVTASRTAPIQNGVDSANAAYRRHIQIVQSHQIVKQLAAQHQQHQQPIKETGQKSVFFEPIPSSPPRPITPTAATIGSSRIDSSPSPPPSPSSRSSSSSSSSSGNTSHSSTTVSAFQHFSIPSSSPAPMRISHNASSSPPLLSDSSSVIFKSNIFDALSDNDSDITGNDSNDNNGNNNGSQSKVDDKLILDFSDCEQDDNGNNSNSVNDSDSDSDDPPQLDEQQLQNGSLQRVLSGLRQQFGYTPSNSTTPSFTSSTSSTALRPLGVNTAPPAPANSKSYRQVRSLAEIENEENKKVAAMYNLGNVTLDSIKNAAKRPRKLTTTSSLTTNQRQQASANFTPTAAIKKQVDSAPSSVSSGTSLKTLPNVKSRAGLSRPKRTSINNGNTDSTIVQPHSSASSALAAFKQKMQGYALTDH